MMPRSSSTFALGVTICVLCNANVIAQTSLDIWVSEQGTPTPTGSQANTFQTVMAAAGRAKSWPASNTIVLRQGYYPQAFTLDPDAIPDEFNHGGEPLTLTTAGGEVATLGSRLGRPKKTLRIMSFNTHLFGGCIGTPSLEDEARALAIFNNGISTLNPKPDVILLQEVWSDGMESDLEEAGVAAGYPYFYHGSGASCFNGGLMTFSKHPINEAGVVDESYSGFGEGANKGYLHVPISLSGTPVVVVNTHTEADYNDWEHRQGQVVELMQHLVAWRNQPGNGQIPLFVGGDFNTAGLALDDGTDPSNCTEDYLTDPFGFTCWEYRNYMVPSLSVAGLNDAHRNSLGFYSPNYGVDPIWSASRANDLHRHWSFDVNSELLDYIFYSRSPAFPGHTTHVIPEGCFIHPMIDGTGFSGPDFYTFDISDHYAIVADFTILVGD